MDIYVKSWMRIIVATLLLYSPSSFCSTSLTIADFMQEASLRDLEISPSGRYLASVWNKGFERTAVVQDLHNKGKIIAHFGSVVRRPNWVKWANDDRLLVFLRVSVEQTMIERKIKKGKDFNIYDYPMFSRLLAVDPDGGNKVILMSDNNRLRRSWNLSRVQHFLPEDPNHIYMNSHFNGRPALYKVNVNSGESERIESGGVNTYQFVSNRKGELQHRYDWLRKSRAVQIWDYTADGRWRKAERIELESDLYKEVSPGDIIGFYGDSRITYRRRNEETGYYELVARDKDGIEELLVAEPGKDVLKLLYGRAGDAIGYAFEDDDVIRIHYFDDDKRDLYARIKRRVDEIGAESFDIYSGYWNSDAPLVVRSSGRNNPGIFHLYDRRKDELSLFNLRYPRLNPMKLGVPTEITYKARDGLVIKGFMLLPPGYRKGEKYPTVLMPHGGPQAKDYANFDQFAQFLATRGYVVIQPNFRGSTGYGRAFEEAGYKQWGLAMQDDLEDAVRFVVERGYADPNRVCIVGGSYGGYAALMGAVRSGEMFKCAVSINGVTDLVDIVLHDMDKFEDYPRLVKSVHSTIGHPELDNEQLAQQSPVNRIEEFDIPVLMIAGTKDDVVPYDQQKKMYKKLKSAKKDVNFIKLKDTGHDVFYWREDIEKVYAEVETFLARYLN